MASPYELLDRKRRGERLGAAEIDAIVAGAVDGTWDDAQLAAFLMAVSIRGMDAAETGALTRAMLESGETWGLSEALPLVGDKHSTGGVGDKLSLILAPVLASCGLPVAMLTGRGLGHTAGTTDKLEGIPGLTLDLSRDRMISTLERTGLAIGMATAEIAPADRRLYALRDLTGTVASVPLITASILSKKLAMGASGVVYDVKTGSGAFLESPAEARLLADSLVATSREMGARATALVTDMSQPLGDWVGHNAEVAEALECLEGGGPTELRDLTVELGSALADLLGVEADAPRIAEELDSGRGRERFFRWAEEQGASADWLARPELPLAPVEMRVEARSDGYLSRVDTRELGLILASAGGGWRRSGDRIDHPVSLRYERRIGEQLAAGDLFGRLYLRREDDDLVRRAEACFELSGEPCERPPLVAARISPETGAES